MPRGANHADLLTSKRKRDDNPLKIVSLSTLRDLLEKELSILKCGGFSWARAQPINGTVVDFWFQSLRMAIVIVPLTHDKHVEGAYFDRIESLQYRGYGVIVVHAKEILKSKDAMRDRVRISLIQRAVKFKAKA